MHRRTFLQSVVATGLCSTISAPLLAMSDGRTQAMNIKHLFNRALAKDSSLLGYSSVKQNFKRSALSVEGTVPKALSGIFMRNGPAKHERGDERYRHLFEGDGMLQQFIIQGGNISHQGKFVGTPKFTKEELAGTFLFSGPDTPILANMPVSSADQVNTANTNVIPVNDELWALWEAGSATAVDIESLAFKRQVNLGSGTEYGNQLKGLPFSAHPKIDPTGDIWNFGLNRSGAVVLYHLDRVGKLKNLKLLNTNYSGGMLHDFLITKDYLLIILPSLVRNGERKGLFNGLDLDSNKAMQVLVIDKNTLSLVKQYELPSGFAFHFGNAWQDSKQNIHFDASMYTSASIIQELADVMMGNRPQHPTNAVTTLFTLKANGQVSQCKLDSPSEFPRVCAHTTGLQNRLLFNVSKSALNHWQHKIIAHDLRAQNSQEYDFGTDFIVEEHIPVCPTNNEDSGYLIGTALHIPSKRSCLNIFDMNDLRQGPLARAWLGYHLPLGFHGNFIAS